MWREGGQGSGGAAAGSASQDAKRSAWPAPGADASGTPGHSPSAGGSASSSSSPASGAPGGRPLAGKVIVLDPGHNPGNVDYPSEINSLVDVGNGSKACDTTGASTNAGYPEAQFTLDVSRRVRSILQAEGATVVLTQDGNRPWGPCVTERAQIGNRAHADAAISIHADGAGASDTGFHVIMPQAVDEGGADNTAIVGPSHTLGMDVRSAFAAATGEPFANYINGGVGYDIRNDLGGLNLSTVPKVFIECANMRNSGDADKLTSASWRQEAAQGIANGLSQFVLHEGH
ncbi:N-acetylmuramoyl-L-alanine amidase [Streptacidiphilus pinicola]|uniref:N-acetylmuramoyl-L-alanine amidase n=1 Tax=Streptacidiphilus pinicola TaxID=2219663 RepID=A0A2X0IW12_9ACTN|nr:N-acetylmuramoyl-L-alanine amidase [Streptacidiphilus pinicola]RAG81856.1 N-acetylmuramoyl-L-alanine amidase [Streptacidiphilus pinicola]